MKNSLYAALTSAAIGLAGIAGCETCNPGCAPSYGYAPMCAPMQTPCCPSYGNGCMNGNGYMNGNGLNGTVQEPSYGPASPETIPTPAPMPNPPVPSR